VGERGGAQGLTRQGFALDIPAGYGSQEADPAGPQKSDIP
jgi:hypothetical protein